MAKTEYQMMNKSRVKRKMLSRALERLTKVCQEVEASGSTPIRSRITHMAAGIKFNWMVNHLVLKAMQAEAIAMDLTIDQFMREVMKSREAAGKVSALMAASAPGKMN